MYLRIQSCFEKKLLQRIFSCFFKKFKECVLKKVPGITCTLYCYTTKIQNIAYGEITSQNAEELDIQ